MHGFRAQLGLRRLLPKNRKAQQQEWLQGASGRFWLQVVRGSHALARPPHTPALVHGAQGHPEPEQPSCPWWIGSNTTGASARQNHSIIPTSPFVGVITARAMVRGAQRVLSSTVQSSLALVLLPLLVLPPWVTNQSELITSLDPASFVPNPHDQPSVAHTRRNAPSSSPPSPAVV